MDLLFPGQFYLQNLLVLHQWVW